VCSQLASMRHKQLCSIIVSIKLAQAAWAGGFVF
jgi:hypothetical protein